MKRHVGVRLEEPAEPSRCDDAFSLDKSGYVHENDSPGPATRRRGAGSGCHCSSTLTHRPPSGDTTRHRLRPAGAGGSEASPRCMSPCPTPGLCPALPGASSLPAYFLCTRHLVSLRPHLGPDSSAQCQRAVRGERGATPHGEMGGAWGSTGPSIRTAAGTPPDSHVTRRPMTSLGYECLCPMSPDSLSVENQLRRGGGRAPQNPPTSSGGSCASPSGPRHSWT